MIIRQSYGIGMGLHLSEIKIPAITLPVRILRNCCDRIFMLMGLFAQINAQTNT